MLEHRDGRLFDPYGAGGSVGSLSGVDPTTNVGRSQLCKRDYIKVRDAGFPPCGPQQACMILLKEAGGLPALRACPGLGGLP